MTGLMEGSPPHVEVAAYILGVLNKEDSEAFDRHLLDCPSCQRELIEMYELPDELDHLKRGAAGTPGAVNGTARDTNGYRMEDGLFAGLSDRTPRPPSPETNGTRLGGVNGAHLGDGVVRDLWSGEPIGPATTGPRHTTGPRRATGPRPGSGHRAASTGRRRAEPATGSEQVVRLDIDEVAVARYRRRRAVLLSAAAAVVIGVTGTVTAQLWPRTAQSAPIAQPQPPAPGDMDVFRKGAGPATGVSGSVGLVNKSWGTEVSFQLSGVRGPERCSLIAVSKNGATDVVSGWQVAAGKGYGVPGFPEPLTLTGGTALVLKDIKRFEVRRDDGVHLLDIPVA
ncbi:hypothetical protein Sru01_53000 [Sphaerisporangium rufum]|uniref:Putative zinc-finger domain-containing protein n=1 Tax=Sphaerisporangium rufum TaxID=1381558 RepID=A0A919R700_9ACTN|nr:zf-HC2 domain-containing protein [Sphaerisporangium rufum]GII80318.1 hypothetical protein Sru01_53000 [Sphaerisporangium rufum]